MSLSSDLDLARAKAKAEEHGIAKAVSVDELLADPEIEIVINLTVPGAHYEVCKATLDAGKHAYVEKPLSITREQGRDLLADRPGQRPARSAALPTPFWARLCKPAAN